LGFKDYVLNPRNWILLVLIVCAIVFKIPALRYFVILIIVVSSIYRIAGKYFKQVKTKADAKLAAYNTGVEALNGVIDYTNVGHIYGSELFCKYYPKYILSLNVLIFGGFAACLYFGMYWQAAFLFIALNLFVILNQIWRQIRRIKT